MTGKGLPPTAVGDVIIATDGHPFWVPELGQWVDAIDLAPGMWLQTSVGTWVQITAIRAWTQAATVHNLTVQDLHTYHVGAGASAVLSHNKVPKADRCTLLAPGPYAVEGVALLDGTLTNEVRSLVDIIGNKYGCHSCGSRIPDASAWIPDHQPPTALVPPGTPQIALPHCRSCANQQRGIVSVISRGTNKGD